MVFLDDMKTAGYGPATLYSKYSMIKSVMMAELGIEVCFLFYLVRFLAG